jgi:hypothetical protein
MKDGLILIFWKRSLSIDEIMFALISILKIFISPNCLLCAALYIMMIWKVDEDYFQKNNEFSNYKVLP